MMMSRTFSSFDFMINIFHNRIFKKLSIYFRLCRFSQASAPACSSARDKHALVRIALIRMTMTLIRMRVMMVRVRITSMRMIEEQGLKQMLEMTRVLHWQVTRTTSTS